MDAQRHRVDGVRTYEWTWWSHRRSKRVCSLSRFDPSRVDRKDSGLHGPRSIEWGRDARPGHGPRCHVTPGGEREGASPPHHGSDLHNRVTTRDRLGWRGGKRRTLSEATWFQFLSEWGSNPNVVGFKPVRRVQSTPTETGIGRGRNRHTTVPGTTRGGPANSKRMRSTKTNHTMRGSRLSWLNRLVDVKNMRMDATAKRSVLPFVTQHGFEVGNRPATGHEDQRKGDRRRKLRLCGRAETNGNGASPSETIMDTETVVEGRVMNAQANFLRVMVRSETEERKNEAVELLCVVRALMKKMKRRVLVGDFVTVSGIDWVDRRGMVMDVLPRKSTMTAPPVANVDHVLLMFSLEEPRAEQAQISRFLIGSAACGLPVTVVLNKADLAGHGIASAWVQKLHEWGYKAIPCSVKQGGTIEPIINSLVGRVSVVAGPSGVGKSSLINAIWNSHSARIPGDAEVAVDPPDSSKQWEPVAVGEISQRSKRGKHTTRHVTLLPLPTGGLLADTPGYSQPAEINAKNVEELTSCFPEALKRLRENGPCQFKDCRHVSEPGCSVRGEWERYSEYLSMLSEIEERERRLLEQGRMKNESGVRLKDAKGGKQTVEAKLEPKKHRRESRKGARQKLADLALQMEEEDEDFW